MLKKSAKFDVKTQISAIFKSQKSNTNQGAVHKLCRLKGEGGQKLPILPSKKTTKRGGGG